MRSKQLSATVLAVAMVLSLVALPGILAAESDTGLEIEVDQDGETVTITVTDDGDGVENAPVNATLADDTDSAWLEAGETDTDGQLSVSAPNASDVPTDTVDVTFEATHENESVETQAEIEAIDDESGLEIDVAQEDGVLVTVTDNSSGVENATLDVTSATENVSYADDGTYTTDDSGTVSLATPNETVDVTFEATHGNESVETTETLESVDDAEDEDGPSNFGSLVSQFVEENRNDTDGPLGLAVSSFVVENNPGNAPDHAGPPEHAGPGGDNDSERSGPPAHAGPGGDNDSDQGPPSHAGSGSDDNDSDDDTDSQGPPSHAASSDDDSSDDSDDDSDDSDDDSDDNSGGGPPSHAGAGNNNSGN